jgi:hypothetical protein
MPSYPIRPTFPVDVRSPTGSVAIGRQGASLTLDVSGTAIVNALPVSPTQFFAALEAFQPGATATVRAAVPADPGDPINRAFQGTNFVTPGCALLVFVTATLGLNSVQVANLLAQAALQPR